MDITNLPMRRGFFYLVAIMDWHTEMVLSWRISNTLDMNFCVQALNEAIYRFELPDIVNSDQRSQFTSFASIDRLRRSRVRIFMDGKGRYLDNILFERLWRTLNLHAWEAGSQAHAGVRDLIELFNYRRRHKALGGQPS